MEKRRKAVGSDQVASPASSKTPLTWKVFLPVIIFWVKIGWHLSLQHLRHWNTRLKNPEPHDLFFSILRVVWFHLKSTHTFCLLLDIMMIFSNNAANLTFQTHLKEDVSCAGESQRLCFTPMVHELMFRKKQSCAFANHTVDGRNPAPVDMVNIQVFTRYYTSQVVQVFFPSTVLWYCFPRIFLGMNGEMTCFRHPNERVVVQIVALLSPYAIADSMMIAGGWSWPFESCDFWEVKNSKPHEIREYVLLTFKSWSCIHSHVCKLSQSDWLPIELLGVKHFWQAKLVEKLLPFPGPTWLSKVSWEGSVPVRQVVSTLPKFNMEPKNDGFQQESPIPGCHFQVLC